MCDSTVVYLSMNAGCTDEINWMNKKWPKSYLLCKVVDFQWRRLVLVVEAHGLWWLMLADFIVVFQEILILFKIVCILLTNYWEIHKFFKKSFISKALVQYQ